MAGLNALEALFQPQPECLSVAFVDALKAGNADGLLAFLTSPEVCLFLQCAILTAGSVLLTAHTQVVYSVEKPREVVIKRTIPLGLLWNLL